MTGARRFAAGVALGLAAAWGLEAIAAAAGRRHRGDVVDEPAYPNDYGIRLMPLSDVELAAALELEAAIAVDLQRAADQGRADPRSGPEPEDRGIADREDQVAGGQLTADQTVGRALELEALPRADQARRRVAPSPGAGPVDLDRDPAAPDDAILDRRRRPDEHGDQDGDAGGGHEPERQSSEDLHRPERDEIPIARNDPMVLSSRGRRPTRAPQPTSSSPAPSCGGPPVVDILTLSEVGGVAEHRLGVLRP